MGKQLRMFLITCILLFQQFTVSVPAVPKFGVRSTLLKMSHQPNNASTPTEQARSSLSTILVKLALKTSMVYIAIVTVIYILILFEVEEPIADVLSNIGKIMTLLIVGIYIGTNFILKAPESYYFLTQVLHFLVILSFFQLFYILFCLFEYYVFWPIIYEVMVFFLEKIRRFLPG